MPWNQSTFLGYVGEEIASLSAVTSFCVVISAVLTFFMSICIYHGAFFEIFKNQFDQIDELTKKPNRYAEIKTKLIEAIEYHINAKM